MFSGIVEAIGKVEKIAELGSNIELTISSPISKEAYIDQSITHNGVCLTVTSFDDNAHTVVAIQETLIKSQLGKLKKGDLVNLERSITADTRMDGHFVQGHVDTIGKVSHIKDENGSWLYTLNYPEEFYDLIVPKGSVTINGISLTVIDPTNNQFQVAIIPYTYEHTNMHKLQIGDPVNLEFDIFGKYVKRYMDRIKKG
jgi:riboflavin synthase